MSTSCSIYVAPLMARDGAVLLQRPTTRRAWTMRLLAGLGSSITCDIAQAQSNEQWNGFDVSNASIPVAAIQRGGPPRDGIPSIDKPMFVRASAAQLAGEDRVLGLVVNGIAHAYPVRIMNWHEVVNDSFGTRKVAVTDCPLCGPGMAFDAQFGALPASFGVSGLPISGQRMGPRRGGAWNFQSLSIQRAGT